VQYSAKIVERSGRLRRYVGPAGKIVNDLRRDDGPAAPASAPASADRTPDIVGRLGDVGPTAAGDSREQRHAEQVMLTVLSHRYGVTLTPRRILLDDGIRVEVDGADTELTILVEAWAHQGPPKTAQKHKVLADVLKLLHIAATLDAGATVQQRVSSSYFGEAPAPTTAISYANALICR
jgi:hypothetical protein